jgi:hypothetical protein
VEITPDLVEPRRHPSTIGGALYLVVLLVTAVGIALVYRSHDWRLGIRVVAGALAGAAVLRLLLPQRDAGMLAVRHRFVDVGLVGAVSAALFFLADSIPDQPLP